MTRRKTKIYVGDTRKDAAHRYSPGRIRGIVKTVVTGRPAEDRISTSFVERQNLTLRMQIRRFTRLTNGFSKKVRNHKAAVALHIAWYNFCRVHETLRVTPAMALGITDHVWSIAELLMTARGTGPTPRPEPAREPKLNRRVVNGPAPERPRPQLRLIKGGKA